MSAILTKHWTRGVNWFDKDPGASLDYYVDWSAWLETGETIAASSWSADGLTTSGASADATKAVVILSGGTDGSSYMVTNRITTTGGSQVRTDERSIRIDVMER